MVTRRTFMKSLGLSALAPAALSALSADETPRSPALEAKTLRLVQYCDPQLGFGEEGFGPSLDRFHKAIDLINDLNPDVVTVLGDLIHRYSDPVDEMVSGLKRIKPQLIVAPGNHDIPDPVTPEKLTRYRNDFGPDRQSALFLRLFCVTCAESRAARARASARSRGRRRSRRS